VELARLLGEIAGTKGQATHAPERPGEQRRSAVDVRKAKRVLGWEPKTSLRAGLTETYQYFAARREGARA
jgi:UDP-glucose 4-epimerase